MVVIVGESASGKTSVAKYLENHYGYERIVTYTTRSPREGEVDGVDYHFISDDEFDELYRKDFFAETAMYNGWCYGSAKEDYIGNKIAVLTPRGLRAVRKNGIDVDTFYLCVPRRDRLKMCLNRGDDVDEACRRSATDVGQFDGISDEVDMVLYNPAYSSTIPEIAKAIDTYVKGKYERV